MRYSGEWFRPAGLLIAFIYFAITRLVVTEAIGFESGIAYLVSGLIPLIIGLGLTAFGVALAIGSYSDSYIKTVAKWTLLGTLTIGVVIAISFYNLLRTGVGVGRLNGNLIFVANMLLTGAIGGTVIGHRTAINLRQRDANKRQANRALLLNRLLRHEVINAATIIRGYANTLQSTDETTVTDRITEASDRITETIDGVEDIIEEGSTTGRIDVDELVANVVEDLKDEYPTIRFEYHGPDSRVEVAADSRLSRVIRELIHFASEDPETTEITFTLEDRGIAPELIFKDNGNDLPIEQRRLLTEGDFPTYDDPSFGFSLPSIRLLVRDFDGQITVPSESPSSGKLLTIQLPRPTESKFSRVVTVSRVQMVLAVFTGVFAGGVMGGYLVLTTDLFPIIGALYGVENSLVGWTTHLFHSVIFALIFAAAHTHPRIRQFSTTPIRGLLTGVIWGVILWLFAAGLVMPLWLTLVGIPAELPNLPTLGLISHVIWGAAIGISYALINNLDLSLKEYIPSLVGSGET